MTTDELIKKYPKIFASYEGNPNGINWYGVPKGWLPIIDKLCGSIQQYLNYHKTSEDNPDYIEGSEFVKYDTSTHRYITKPLPQMTCLQMKEKFGGLRFYVKNSNSEINGMIKMAEYICNTTCETCGTEENLGITKGWISVMCKSCAEEKNKEWSKEEDSDEK
jgi:hypothetical protein